MVQGDSGFACRGNARCRGNQEYAERSEITEGKSESGRHRTRFEIQR